MKSYELLRAAATLILEGGWAAGEADAADAAGDRVELWVTGSTETGRAAPNPAAVRFSAYGAIVKALHDGGGRLEDPAAMWTLLAKRAAEINGVPAGGDNFVHPLRQLNATGLDVEKVLAFLGKCANEMEGVNRALAMLAGPEPASMAHTMIIADLPDRAIPRLTEPAPFDRVALGSHPSEPTWPITLSDRPTMEDVKDLHTTLAVPFREPVLPADVEITGITPPVLLPYKPMLTPRTLREEHPPALYSGPELNMKGMPNPFGGDDEV